MLFLPADRLSRNNKASPRAVSGPLLLVFFVALLLPFCYQKIKRYGQKSLFWLLFVPYFGIFVARKSPIKTFCTILVTFITNFGASWNQVGYSEWAKFGQKNNHPIAKGYATNINFFFTQTY